MPDYIPRRDGDIRSWADNFSGLITANPNTYGLMASDAAAIAGYVDAFGAALTVAVDPATKTKATVAAKDAAHAAMLAVVRRYAQLIKLNLGVSNEEKISLGLTVDDPGRRPIPAPTTQPVCTIIGATPLQHTLRFFDAGSPTRRAKPPGAAALEIHYVVAPPATPVPLSPNGSADLPATFYGLVTHQPYQINLRPADVGKTATYYARWVTRTGLVGPWSSPVGMTVAA